MDLCCIPSSRTVLGLIAWIDYIFRKWWSNEFHYPSLDNQSIRGRARSTIKISYGESGSNEELDIIYFRSIPRSSRYKKNILLLRYRHNDESSAELSKQVNTRGVQAPRFSDTTPKDLHSKGGKCYNWSWEREKGRSKATTTWDNQRTEISIKTPLS